MIASGEQSHRFKGVIGPAVVVVAMTLWWLLVLGSDLLAGQGYSRGRHVAGGLLAIGFTLPLIVVARRYLDRRPWSWSLMGLTAPRKAWRPFLFGVACWLVPATISTVAAETFGWISISVHKPVLEIVAGVAVLTVLVLLIEPIPEELAFRGYIQGTLAQRYPAWVAVLGQAMAFTVLGTVITLQADPFRIVLLLTFGSLLGALRATIGSLWPCLGFHTAFMVTSQYLNNRGNGEIDHPEVLDLTFIVIPFACTAILLWAVHRRASRSSAVPSPSRSS
ncbi:CPBP family intramembrane glutamic endopeptidase [Nocardia transvalensis]|uniref:CPBP family intramembrane glutamic endopeptidase n=1 Tax=Nocardia transvalensis TaxID=37333 RepID=UPI001894B97D|nr:type II CAAX endopeptidase family protein [Nocardia transvalensis]MBF6329680.1 CPBP family intramembrane metalloprotease [Nocardia transvalensis]